MSRLKQILDRPQTSLLVIAVVTFILCVLQDRVLPAVPQIQDEFSYLLAADTFSEGRLTNPPHVLWRFFDTTHVIELPTYQSKYQPGQGLVLALGQVLTGSPLFGVWLSFAAACAAVGWMLQAWLPMRWALLGGLMAAFNVGNLRFWGGTFMGGAVAMLGGALLFGALARALKDPRPRNGVLLALGVLILAISRPFEGLIASLPAAFVLLAWVVRQKEFPTRLVWRRLLAPLTITLALGAGWIAYYNYRVTGDPLRMPYQLYLERVGNDAFFDPNAKPVNRQRVDNIREQIALRFDRQFIHHIGGERYYAIAILVALRWLMKSLWARFSLATVILTILATSFTRGAMPHYSAPIAGLAIGLIAQSLSIIVSWLRWRYARLIFVGGFIGLFLFNNTRHFLREVSYWEIRRDGSFVEEKPSFPMPELHDLDHIEERQAWEQFSRFAILARPYYIDRFEADEDRHLILVRYAENSNRHREWVYNRADIDKSSSVWALWLDEEPLWPLLTYYKDRKVWLLEPEDDPWAIRPFPVEEIGTWNMRTHENAAATLLPGPLADDFVRLEIARPGEKLWYLQLERPHPALEKGKMYFGGFRLRADAPRDVSVLVTQGLRPWSNLGFARRVRVTEEWRTFSYGFRAIKDYAVPRLVFNFGATDTSLEISDVWMAPQPTAGGSPDDSVAIAAQPTLDDSRPGNGG